jgi:hypothetical protein
VEYQIENRLLALLIIVTAIFNIIRMLKRRTLITAIGGLHLNLLIFYGIGPIANTFVTLWWDYKFARGLNVYTNQILTYVAFCYLIFTVITVLFFNKRNSKSARWLEMSQDVSSLNRLNAKILVLAFVGYLFADQEIAFSGIGTIFPVFKNLLFPSLVLMIYNARKQSPTSIVLLLAGFMLVGMNAFFSTWRSELIMFMFSIGIGLVLRNKKFLKYGIIFGPLFIALVLPFQLLKKSGKISEDENIVSAFFNTLSNPDLKRSNLALDFLSFRLNYARECAYVLRGIKMGSIEYRYGETYNETVLQLVPRVFWPDKPSYNYLINRVIPRKIGLLSNIDKYTSWGLNYYAEFLYNFPLNFFPVFFVFYFLLLALLGRLAESMKLSNEALLLLQFTLFFQVLNTVSLTFSSTYFLWIFIVIKLLDVLNLRRTVRYPAYKLNTRL